MLRYDKVFWSGSHSKLDKNRGDYMAFEQGREKTGGRRAGTRNKVNMFDQSTIDQAKAVIAAQVASGDVEAAKLVLSYSLSKPAAYSVGIAAELEAIKSAYEMKRIIKKDKEDDFFNI